MHRFRLILGLLLLGHAATSQGGIHGNTPLKIDFTKEKEMADQITWFDAAHFGVSEKGFGWEGEKNTSRDGWIETKPVGIGTRWRPTHNAGIVARFDTDYPTIEKISANGKAFRVPTLFARYSADRKHWSDWQALRVEEDPRHVGKFQFVGNLGVARRASRDYYERMEAWSQRDDVAWGSDEEAFCEWLVKENPQYFETHRPFIGYVQFLIEGSFRSGEHLKTFAADISWAVSGIHMLPKDPDSKERPDRNGIWNFERK